MTNEHRERFLYRLAPGQLILAGRRPPRDPNTLEVPDDGWWGYVEPTIDGLRDYSHIAIRGRFREVYVAADIDLPFDEAIAALTQFPLRPNLYGQNLHSGHVQGFWRLEVPVQLDNDLAVRNLRALQRQITAAVGGDVAYNYSTARNPLAMNSEYLFFWGHDDGHSITELRTACYWVLGEEDARAAGRVGPRITRDYADSDPTEYRPHVYSIAGCTREPSGVWKDKSGRVARRRTLFEEIRHVGYALRDFGMEAISDTDLQPEADRLLALFEEAEPNRTPLHRSHINSVIRSVARFCNTRYGTGTGGHRAKSAGHVGGRTAWDRMAGLMEWFRTNRALPASVAARQARSIARAEQIRVQKAENPEWTQQMLAAHFGCHRSTIQRALAQAEDQDLSGLESSDSTSYGGEGAEGTATPDRYVDESLTPTSTKESASKPVNGFARPDQFTAGPSPTPFPGLNELHPNPIGRPPGSDPPPRNVHNHGTSLCSVGRKVLDLFLGPDRRSPHAPDDEDNSIFEGIEFSQMRPRRRHWDL